MEPEGAKIWHFTSLWHLPVLKRLLRPLNVEEVYLITSNTALPEVETCPVVGADTVTEVMTRPLISDLVGLDEVKARQLVSEKFEGMKEGVPVVAMISPESFVMLRHGTDSIQTGEISLNDGGFYLFSTENHNICKEYELLKDVISITTSPKHGLTMSLRNVPASKPADLEILARLNRIRQKQTTEWFYNPVSVSENSDITQHGISFQIVEFLQSVSDIQHVSTERSLDFSEKLWILCQKAGNLEDLLESFSAVANELESGRLKPMIHKTNQSKFANIVRECYRSDNVSQLFDAMLDSENILSYLIEMGIDKLKRDLFYMLINKNLISVEQFESFFGTSSISESIFRLFVFQRILEPWQLLKENVLTITAEYERKIIHSAFSYWSKRLDSIDFADLNQSVIYEFKFGKYSKWAQDFSQLLDKNYSPKCSWYDFTDKNTGDHITLAKDETGTELICSISSF